MGLVTCTNVQCLSVIYDPSPLHLCYFKGVVSDRLLIVVSVGQLRVVFPVQTYDVRPPRVVLS